MHTLFHIHIIHHRLLETKRKPAFTPRKRTSTRQWCDVPHSDRHGAHDFYHAPDVTFRSNARYRKRTTTCPSRDTFRSNAHHGAHDSYRAPDVTLRLRPRHCTPILIATYTYIIMYHTHDLFATLNCFVQNSRYIYMCVATLSCRLKSPFLLKEFGDW